MVKCEYRKTVSGSCNQWSYNGILCYYHVKVNSGLIDADEQEVFYDLPNMRK